MARSKPPGKPNWHPVIGGIVIGLLLVLGFFLAGRGLGASGAITRLAVAFQHRFAPAFTENSLYFAPYLEVPISQSYLIFLLLGLLAGSFVAALRTRTLRLAVIGGPRVSPQRRLGLAFLGGLLVGFGARLARGCTSGQVLVGGAQLSLGSWVFMVCIFLGGFAGAWFVRRQWL